MVYSMKVCVRWKYANKIESVLVFAHALLYENDEMTMQNEVAAWNAYSIFQFFECKLSRYHVCYASN